MCAVRLEFYLEEGWGGVGKGDICYWAFVQQRDSEMLMLVYALVSPKRV